MNYSVPFCSGILVSCCRLLILSVVCLVGIEGGTAARGQENSELSAAYGRGVHAFFAGDSDKAEMLFSNVLGAGSRDPRVYYFRALTRLRSGRQYEAEEDMQMGAALEARDPGKRYAIGNALQRIQGTDRRTLEKFRREARLSRVQENRGLVRHRYENLRTREPEVLHQQNPVLLEQLVEPAVEGLTVPQSAPPVESGPLEVLPADVPAEVSEPQLPGSKVEESVEEDLFESAVEPEPATEVEPQAAPAKVIEEDPFGAPATEAPTPATEPAQDDLLSTSEPEPAIPAQTEEVPVEAVPAEVTDEVPADAATEEDPFGAPAPQAEAPATEPAEDDLFGTAESEPAAEAVTTDSAPVESVPAEAVPPVSVPVESAPVEATPTESVPADNASGEDLFGSPEEDAPTEASETSVESASEAAPADSNALDSVPESTEEAPAEEADAAPADADLFGEVTEETSTPEATEEVEVMDEDSSEAAVEEAPEAATDESTEDPFGESAKESQPEEESTEQAPAEGGADEGEGAAEEDPFGGF